MQNKKVRSYNRDKDGEVFTNIEGLPLDSGEVYMTKTGYSQSYPYVVVGQSASGKTLHLREVKVKRDPDWTPEIHPGGFAGHCSNQSDQTWLYDGVDPVGPVTKVRLKKSRYCGSDLLWGNQHEEFIAGGAVYFYDYNF